LSGLHSYAAGDPVAIPVGVYYALVIIAIVSLFAAYNEFVVKKKYVPKGSKKSRKSLNKSN